MTDVFEIINKEFIFPFEPYAYQRKALNTAVTFRNLLLPLKVGRGKTPMATWRLLFDALAHDVNQGVVIVPPSLVVQWQRWLQRIRHVTGGGLDVLAYYGTPGQRAAMDLVNPDVIVMSRNIFVKDFKRISNELGSKNNIHVVYDEAQEGLRNISNKIWRYYHQFTSNKRTTLLSGTPVDRPADVYAICKLLDPTIYPTKRKFENLHVGNVDFFGKVTEWKGEELMRENLYKNAVLIPDSELAELPGLVIQDVPYELGARHRKLYDEFVSEQLLTTDSGQVLDGTETNRMFHALQRFVTCPDRMDFRSIQAVLHEILWDLYNEDEGKLIIAAYYRDTNQGILEFFQGRGVYAVGCWGDHTREEQRRNLDDFMGNDACQVLVGNWGSFGVGTDGLQQVCSRMVLAELPLTPSRFEQLTGRLDRTGQVNKCIVKCLIAIDTIQETLFTALLGKDDLLQKITMQHTSMRDLLKRSK